MHLGGGSLRISHYAEQFLVRIERLDGLRALAITLVVGHHYGHLGSWPSRIGYSGVDLFFVLSGFLITGILRKTRTIDNYWSRFYIRRVARILPPLALLIALDIVSTKHIQPLTLLGYCLFAGNIVQVINHGVSVLSPLWSLAVEEQFYLLWPVAVLFFNRRTLLVAFTAVLIAEPVVRALASPHFATYLPIYYLTPFRLDSLAAGSLLALLTEKGEFPGQRWCGLAALAISPLFPFCSVEIRNTNSLIFNALAYSFLAVVYFLLVAWVLTLRRGFFYKALSSKPLTALGKISYGVYLFHLPIRHALCRTQPCRDPFPVDILVTVTLAAISFRFIESPTMARARAREAPREALVES